MNTRGMAAVNILRGAVVCGAILLAGACAKTATDASIKTQQSHRLIAKTFLDLPAWSRDRHGEALHAFQKSCPILVSRAAPVIRDVFETPPDWRRVCAEAGQTDPDDQIASRLFFRNMVPAIFGDSAISAGWPLHRIFRSGAARRAHPRRNVQVPALWHPKRFDFRRPWLFRRPIAGAVR